jgi:hypothetical protein
VGSGCSTGGSVGSGCSTGGSVASAPPAPANSWPAGAQELKTSEAMTKNEIMLRIFEGCFVGI